MARKPKAATIADLIDDEPGRLAALWAELRRPVLWTVLAFVSIGAVVAAGTSGSGGSRLAELPEAIDGALGRAAFSAPGPRASQTAELRADAQRNAIERARLELRLAELERGFGEVAGSLRRSASMETTASIVRPPAEGAGTASEAPRPSEAVPASPGAVTIATRSQFGLDLGGEPTLNGLRSRWQRLTERHRPVLAALEPLVGVRDGPSGQPALFLVAGPLADVAEAASLCARLRAAGASACQPASFDGQRLLQR